MKNIKNIKYIYRRTLSIAGNIGVGKTWLGEEIVKYAQNSPLFSIKLDEGDMNNPYLNKFYTEPNRFAFHMQMWFMENRMRRTLQAPPFEDNCLYIQDRTLSEEREIFVKLMRERQWMDNNEHELYSRYCQVISDLMPKPEVVFYLKADTHVLSERIIERGREYEKNISIQYLTELSEKYDDWYERNKDKLNIIVLDFNEDRSGDKKWLENEVLSVIINDNKSKRN